MAIRVSGINSGLDTDSIVKELVSAYSVKKQTYDKALTKQQWTMDAWKTTNTKVYSFYSSSLSSMRFSSNYNLRQTSVSNNTVAKVTASSDAVTGTQSLSVKQLATSGYLTGARIKNDEGKNYEVSAKLSEVGITDGTISLNGKDIEITGDMTLSELATKMKQAGVNANYDSNNGRFFISSKASGADNEFTLIAKDSAGLSALKTLGIFSPTKAELAQYKSYSSMTEDEIEEASEKLYLKNYKAGIQSAYNSATAQAEAAQNSLDALTDLQNEYDRLINLEDYTTEYQDDDAGEEGAKTALEKYEAAKAELLSKMEEYDEDTLISTRDSQQAIADANKLILEKTDEELIADADEDALEEARATIEGQMTFTSGIAASDLTASKGSSRISAQDAEIYLNGAKFTGSTNSFAINGLTIEATGTTDVEIDEDGEFVQDKSAVSISTAVDTQGIYDKIKEFIGKYNELVKYIDELYYADSAKGYEPLTDDERDSMTDTQIEDWEKKIKDSLLRKNSTIGAISREMKSAILGARYTNSDGKSYSLSSFGIQSSGYFTSSESDRGTFHIDGDADDSVGAGKQDKLMEAIVQNPDDVVSFFQNMSQGLYDVLTKKMATSSLSSAFTIYNDKEMSSQYSDYKDKVTSWEEKLKDYEDYYYKKFSAMETALGTMNSNMSQFSSMLG